MARGRMISHTLGESRRYAALTTDIARVLYPLIVANTDAGGRLESDPLYVTRKVCTRLPYDQASVEHALDDMHNVGLIVLYEHDGVPYLQVVKFRTHNTPHHKEPESEIPPPPGYNWDGTEIETAEKPDQDTNPDDGSKQGASTPQARAKNAPKQALKGSKGKERELEENTPPTPPPRDPVAGLTGEGPIQALGRDSPAIREHFEEICRVANVKYRAKLAQADALLAAINEHGARRVEDALAECRQSIGDKHSPFGWVMSRLQRGDVSVRREAKQRREDEWEAFKRQRDREMRETDGVVWDALVN